VARNREWWRIVVRARPGAVWKHEHIMSPSNTETQTVPSPPLTAHLARQVAVLATCDPRSVIRVVRGQPTRAAVRARVVEALRQLAAEELQPAPAAQEPQP
jgi:hypothetical protein